MRGLACTPSGHDLSAHEVVEHEDGTIGGKTVLVEGDAAERFERVGLTGYWHGYLEAGVWRSC